MCTMSAAGRFAPSPSGPLHLGSLRTALAAWLFARSQSARFLLRIEDLDPQRSRPEFEAAAIADLRAIGIDWDEPPVRQSRRTALYAQALSRLAEMGRLYPCFCTRAEIREAASAPHGTRSDGVYPGTCGQLSDGERCARIKKGRPHALRLRADGQLIEFEDRLLGPRAVQIDDFVVRRADGVHSYQLAVVVDDAAQRIGEVVRGADLADSTARQILLANLLGFEPPTYAHVPLVLAADGSRLAKRHRAATMADRGEPRSATLALLAHSLGLADDRDHVHHPGELLDEFDPARIPSGPLVLEA
jgi:glutamyl-tRNA synthetase